MSKRKLILFCALAFIAWAVISYPLICGGVY